MFSPLSITLIHGVNHAVFIDAPLTTDQANAVGDWEAASGQAPHYIVATHGHLDVLVRSDEYGGAAGEIFFGCRVQLNIPHCRLTSAERCCEVQSYLVSRCRPIPT
jgi:hypothetical protein